jgi:hypothetical protein
MTQYPVPTTHSILVGGLPLFMEFEAAESSAILPGDLVQFNNPPADCTIKEGQNEHDFIIGVANIHPVGAATPPRGGDRTTAFAAGDQVEVIRGPITVMLRIASSEEIQCGEYVQPAASGEVKAYVCGTDHDCERIAQALETTAQDTESFQWGMFALERLG